MIKFINYVYIIDSLKLLIPLNNINSKAVGSINSESRVTFIEYNNISVVNIIKFDFNSIEAV